MDWHNKVSLVMAGLVGCSAMVAATKGDAWMALIGAVIAGANLWQGLRKERV